MDLSDRSATLANLREVFVEFAISAQQMAWFAQQAEIEGLPDAAAALHAKAAADSSHARAIMDHLAEFDPHDIIAAKGPMEPMTLRSLHRSDHLTVDEVIARAVLPSARALVERVDAVATAVRRDGHGLLADSLDSLVASQCRHLDAIGAAIEPPVREH